MNNKFRHLYSRRAFPVLLTLILLIVLANNLEERYRMRQLGHSFQSVFEDRLMVESYIYRLSELIHDKYQNMEKLGSHSTSGEAACIFNEETTLIRELLTEYEMTFLTEKESALFSSLKTAFSELSSQENGIILAMQNDLPVASLKSGIHSTLEQISGMLSGLSDIQIVEGKRLNEHSHQIILARASSSRLELTILIVLGLLTHAWLFASRGFIQAIRPRDVQMN